MLVIERIREFINYTGKSLNAFEKSIGTRSTISKAIKNKGDIGVSWIVKICEVYKEVNPTWLLTGSGNMLLEIDYNIEKSGIIIDDRVLTNKDVLKKVLIFFRENHNTLKEDELYKMFIKMSSIDIDNDERKRSILND